MDSRDYKVRFISLFSGFSAGLFRTLIGHPFDTIKVLVQTRGRNGVDYASMRMSRLYRGIGPPIIATGVVTSLNFSLYENFRLSLLKTFPNQPEPLLVFSGATLSGSILVFLTSPLDNLKVIQQTRTANNSNNLTMRSFLFGRSKFSPYRALTSNLVAAGIGRGIYILSYTEARKFWMKKLNYDSKAFLPKALAASLAGIGGWLFLFPFDVVRSNMMSDYKKEKYQSTSECFKSIYHKSGIRGLYLGLSYTLIRAVPVAISSLVTYDYTQEFLLEKLNT